jgi:aldehyde dehydrogenase
VNISENQIRGLIREVLDRFQPAPGQGGASPSGGPAAGYGGAPSGGGSSYAPVYSPPTHLDTAKRIPSPDLGLGVFETMDQAIRAAKEAFPAFRSLKMTKRREIVEALRAAALENAPDFARGARDETGMGRVDHKIIKHEIVARLTPGPEIIEPKVFTGDRGLTLVDYAPFGVIGAITPSTHPVPTLLCNAICFLSGGNTAAFNSHPAAKRTFADALQKFNRVIQAHGGPPNVITTVMEPTIDTGKELFFHPDVALILVTGGPAVVAEALKAPKRAVCAGPGNPPVVVDETADLELAAREIINGAAFDNNILCIGEKEVFVVEKVFEPLRQAMRRVGCVELERHDIDRLAMEAFMLKSGSQVISCSGARLNRELVGRDAWKLADAIGLKVPRETPMLIGEVPFEHAWVQEEQLMPFLPLVRVRDVWEGIDKAIAAEHNYRHTATIFSHNVKAMSEMARRLEVSIFVKNGPSYAGLGQGGEGYTSFSIATPTGEGLTTARTFCRERRCAMIDKFRIV